MEEKPIQIIEKVTPLFMRYGIRSVSMDDISHELGISKKTLYMHFEDKSALVKQTLVRYLQSMGEKFREIVSVKRNAIETLFEISQYLGKLLLELNPSIMYDLQKYYPEVMGIMNEHKKKHVFNNVKANLIKGMEEGYYRKDMNAEIIAILYVSRMDISVNPGILNIGGRNMAEVYDELFRYHVRGIASKKGLDYLEKKLNKDANI
jgi:TetR/AcrR family transcriptional regulator, cholesterol catabolism regulator